jgi:hypothetical protein
MQPTVFIVSRAKILFGTMSEKDVVNRLHRIKSQILFGTMSEKDVINRLHRIKS